MVANIQTIAFQGVDAVPVEVQVHLAPGQNAFNVVGLPDKSVAESRERVRAALSAIGLALPYDRITINFSPADLPKEGSHYDVPIALGLLVAMGALPQNAVRDFYGMGELGLDGTLIGVPGALPAAMAALAAPDKPGIIAAKHLLEALNHLRGVTLLPPPQARPTLHADTMPDMADIRGQAKPGEISLAHCGVLFLDELPEFSRQTLDALRQPIETGQVDVARAEAHVSYHARFQFVAAMNPCRCGHADDASLACHRLPLCRQEYLAKLSGPLLDRFDIRINAPPVPLSQMIDDEKGESSAAIADRVGRAQETQLARQNCLNARLDGEALRALAAPDGRGRKLLDAIIDDGGLTARGFNRILRVARSLADLAGRDGVTDKDIATALVWRGHA
ncbi:MAG: YifB family Mg chelatase-like AAA ATPase [Parvibaculales bacterium]